MLLTARTKHTKPCHIQLLRFLIIRSPLSGLTLSYQPIRNPAYFRTFRPYSARPVPVE
jgi:hypothetical protein